MKAKIKLIDEEKEWNFMWVQKPQIKKKFSDRARAIVTRTKKKVATTSHFPWPSRKRKSRKTQDWNMLLPPFPHPPSGPREQKKRVFFVILCQHRLRTLMASRKLDRVWVHTIKPIDKRQRRRAHKFDGLNASSGSKKKVDRECCCASEQIMFIKNGLSDHPAFSPPQ
jgi:hypothetical protein